MMWPLCRKTRENPDMCEGGIPFPQYKRQASRVLKTGRPIGSHVCPKEGTPSLTQRVLVSKPFQYKKTVYIYAHQTC